MEIKRRGFFSVILGSIIALMLPKKSAPNTTCGQVIQVKEIDYTFGFSYGKTYRGYSLDFAPGIRDHADPDLIVFFSKAYPIGSKLSIDGKDYLPFLIEISYSEEQAYKTRQHLKVVIDQIMDHPEKRWLTSKQWNEWLGYDGLGQPSWNDEAFS
jgi:hypothetical protein